LLTEAGTVSVFGTSLISRPALDRREEVRKPVSHRGQEFTDVVDDVGRTGRLLDHPPYDERNSKPSEDGFKIHVDSHRRRDLSCLPENLMLARTGRPANANGVKLPCRGEYARPLSSVCPIGENSV
jgi:hypothetical protein